MKHRRIGFAGLSLLFLLPVAGRAGDLQPGGSRELSPEAVAAIRRGLDWLVARQNEDGSWSAYVGRKAGFDYEQEKEAPHVGISSLACLSLLAGGNTPTSGRYARHLDKGLDFILSCVTDSGFITRDDTRMYSHGFATLFLAEVCGESDRPDIREKVQRAVNLIVRSQNGEGGWRYLPGDEMADTSITICQVQALRAARNAGISVSQRTIENAIRYVRAMRVEAPHSRGAFRYTMSTGLTSSDRASFPLTAAGVTSLYGLGVYDPEEHRESLDRLVEARRGRDSGFGITLPPNRQQRFDYFYGHYYAIQAMYQAGGNDWRDWWPSVRDEILSIQQPDGFWIDAVHPTYATAMATLILQVPYRYLPIFQR